MQSTSLFRTLRHNLHQFWIAVDQLCNVLVSALFREKAWADETLSAHAWRWHLEGRDWPCRLIDALIFWEKDHCRASYESEIHGLQLPERERNNRQ